MKLSTLFLTAIIILLGLFSFQSSAHASVPLPKFKPIPTVASEVIRAENIIMMPPVLDSDEPSVPIEKVTRNVLNNSDQFSSLNMNANNDKLRSEELPSDSLSDAVAALDAQAWKDIECLTEAIYFESVGEPVLGQVAVANVIMNRANWNVNEREPHERHRIEFSGDICDVVAFKISRTAKKAIHTENKKKKKKKWIEKTYTTCAFSYRCERGFHAKLQAVKKKERWNEIKKLAKETYIRYNSGENVDPSQGATHYHASWMKKYPWWSRHYKKTKQIGLHIFYTTP
jgi:hypothetical protein